MATTATVRRWSTIRGLWSATSHRSQASAHRLPIPRPLTVAAFVLLGLSATASAQSDPLHRGVVYDDRGAPMPGVVVVLEHPRERGVRVAVTDHWGEYAVDHLDRGTRYVVHFTHPAFRTARLQASAGDHINVTLKPKRPPEDARRALLTAARR